jgi:eukaryotic-like serine/threonine-protein kinase
MDFFTFLFTKTFWKYFGIACGIMLGIVIMISLTLKVYTHHGQAFSVPDIKGLTVEEATEVLNDHDLTLQVIDSAFIPGARGGTVIDQNPPSDFKVKKNRTIFVTMTARNPQKVKMPDLINLTLRQAKTLLEAQGLQVGKLVYTPDIGTNIVMGQRFRGMNLGSGSKVVKGAYIDLILGSGLGSERTSVPYVLGLTVENARRTLVESSLNTGRIQYDNTVKNGIDSSKAIIYRQFPGFDGTSVALGSSVDLFASKDVKKVPQKVVTTKNEVNTTVEDDSEEEF